MSFFQNAVIMVISELHYVWFMDASCLHLKPMLGIIFTVSIPSSIKQATHKVGHSYKVEETPSCVLEFLYSNNLTLQLLGCLDYLLSLYVVSLLSLQASLWAPQCSLKPRASGCGVCLTLLSLTTPQSFWTPRAWGMWKR